MTEKSSFVDLITRLRAGDERAAAAIFQRFAHGLIVLARDQLDTWMRLREDPEDIVQSVYKSFFSRHAQGQFNLGSWNDLWGLLTLMTLRKCVNRVEYYRAQRRDAACELPLQAGSEGSGLGWQVIDREPTPLEAVVLMETVQEVLGSMEGDDRAIIELSLQSHTTEEIAERLGLSKRTVRRVRERLKKRLERMQMNDRE
jgi:RNA polymerase sigma-70 factor (ECF subfamily)